MKKYVLNSVISFITATLFSAVIFVLSGIYPGSERTLLVFDMLEQFVSFYSSLKSVLSDGGSFIYSFMGSLGTPYIGMFAYYLASPFSLLTLLFDVRRLPDAIWLMDILKCGMIAASFSDTSIAAGLLLLIEGIIFWAMGNGNNPLNSAASPIRAVPGMKKTVQELCDALDNTETQLGFPWLGRIRTIKNDTIIYGPSEEGVFVYGYYHFGRFYVTFSKDVSLLDEGEADAHRITEIPDSKGICLGEESLPEAYACMITQYLKNGNPIWSTKLKK